MADAFFSYFHGFCLYCSIKTNCNYCLSVPLLCSMLLKSGNSIEHENKYFLRHNFGRCLSDVKNLNFFRILVDGCIRLATFLEKRLWHRCFPVNFAKFLRTPFLQNTSGRLLLAHVNIHT